MTGTLRALSFAVAAFYGAASAYHLVLASGALNPASIAEALLGIVMLAGALGVIRSALATYIVVLAGTLFGLTIVTLIGGPFTIDFWIHIVMLAGLATGFALIFGRSGRTRST